MSNFITELFDILKTKKIDLSFEPNKEEAKISVKDADTNVGGEFKYKKGKSDVRIGKIDDAPNITIVSASSKEEDTTNEEKSDTQSEESDQDPEMK